MNLPLEPTLVGLVREVLPRRLQRTPLEEGLSLRGDLGLDSIGLMSLAFRIEEEYLIDLMAHADQVAAIQTLGDVQRFITQLKRQAQA
jgi:acyl carrier protein